MKPGTYRIHAHRVDDCGSDDCRDWFMHGHIEHPPGAYSHHPRTAISRTVTYGEWEPDAPTLDQVAS